MSLSLCPIQITAGIYCQGGFTVSSLNSNSTSAGNREDKLSVLHVVKVGRTAGRVFYFDAERHRSQLSLYGELDEVLSVCATGWQGSTRRVSLGLRHAQCMDRCLLSFLYYFIRSVRLVGKYAFAFVKTTIRLPRNHDLSAREQQGGIRT